MSRAKLAPARARSATLSSIVGVEAVRLAITRMRVWSAFGKAAPQYGDPARRHGRRAPGAWTILAEQDGYLHHPIRAISACRARSRRSCGRVPCAFTGDKGREPSAGRLGV